MKNQDKSYLFLSAWRMFCGGAVEPVAEYNFDAEIGRKHRFDWAFVEQKIAVEVDGGGFAKFGGRHATDKDREKMNIAARLGWRVFRFSPRQLTDDPQACALMVYNSLGILESTK